VTVPVDLRTIADAWTIPPITGVAVAASAAVYAFGVARLREKGRRWPAWRSCAFGGGLAVLVVALCSGLAHYDTSVFALHVLQHLLLAMVAPPLLALGAPITLALQASSRRAHRGILAVLHSRPVVAVTNPLVVLVLFGGSIIGLYFTPVYALSLRHAWLHDLVHLHFVVVGCLFFWPIVGLDPVRWRLPYGARLLYVIVALPFHSIAGLALTLSSAPLWPGWHTVADQQAGGGVMLLGGDLITLMAFGVVFRQWMAAEQRAAARADAFTP
jgi:putative membrane protein